MLHSLFLVFMPAALMPVATPVDVTSTASSSFVQTPKEDPEYVKRKKAAGKDPTELWKLYEWCKEQKKEKEAKAALRAIVKVDPLHKEANIALGNLFYDGKWFENQKKIDEYKKQQEIDAKHAQGLVEYKGEWVPKDDVPFLEKGLVKDDAGNWADPEIVKKLKEGWVKQDFTWIPPAEKPNVEKGLWKCGDEWLSLADANKWHSELDQWWRIPTEHYTIWTTCDRELALNKMKPQLDAAYEDLEKVYATKLDAPLNVLVLHDHDEYNAYAAGLDGRQPAESQNLCNVHYACFADLALLPDDADAMGLAYWDSSTDEGNKYGVHAVRLALGLSFSYAMDPSPKAAAALKKTGNADAGYLKKFYEEKSVPVWFRYGAASYVERYFDDKTVAIGGDHQWPKKWSVANILGQGGLRPLKQILEFKLRLDQGQDGAKLISEAGLLVDFAMEGNCAPVQEKFKAVQSAIKANKLAKESQDAKDTKDPKEKKALAEAFKAFEAELVKNEAELRKFAGL